MGNGAKYFTTAAIGRRVAGITLVGGIGGGLVFPILPALGLQLGIAGGMIGLILSANRLSRRASAPWAGRLVDRLGGKIPMSTGCWSNRWGFSATAPRFVSVIRPSGFSPAG
jgi:MFS family permease